MNRFVAISFFALLNANAWSQDKKGDGDLHFHTEISFDTRLIGTGLTMHDTFLVARGECILSNTGQPVQLIRPLDFLAITEHAEMLGLATTMRGSDPRLVTAECRCKAARSS